MFDDAAAAAAAGRTVSAAGFRGDVLLDVTFVVPSLVGCGTGVRPVSRRAVAAARGRTSRGCALPSLRNGREARLRVKQIKLRCESAAFAL